MIIKMDNGVKIIIRGDECEVYLTDGKAVKINSEGVIAETTKVNGESADQKYIGVLRDSVAEMRLS